MPTERLNYYGLVWEASSNTLTRIKSDETKWLFFAFAVIGGVLSTILVGFGSKLVELPCRQGLTILMVVFGALQLFTAFWVGQALTLRKQYYTTLIRLLNAEVNLGHGVPSVWHSYKGFKDWRLKATKPYDSKMWEIMVLSCLLLFVALALAYALEGLPPKTGWVYSTALVLGGSAVFIWPFVVYPRWDKHNLQDAFKATQELRRLWVEARTQDRLR